MQGKTPGRPRKRASAPAYVSTNQAVLPGSETSSSFDQKLTLDNLWAPMARQPDSGNVWAGVDRLRIRQEQSLPMPVFSG